MPLNLSRKPTNLFKFSVVFLIIISTINSHGMSPDEIAQTVDDKTITYGSSLRIQNTMTKIQVKFNIKLCIVYILAA